MRRVPRNRISWNEGVRNNGRASGLMMKFPHVRVGFIDQFLSSGSNTMIVFAIARVSSVDSFGAISLAMAALMASLAVCRGALGAPISLFSNQPNELRFQTRHSLVAAGALGLLASLIIVPLGLRAGGTPMAVILGVAAPIVLMQDVGRFYVAAASRPWVAVISDGVWALFTLLLLVCTFVGRPAFGALWVIAGWVLAAVVAMILIMSLGGVYPEFSGIRAWLDNSSYHRRRFGLEAGVGASGSFGAIVLAGSGLGSAAIAALRGAGTVLGPIAVLVSATQFSVVPELRRLNLSTEALWNDRKLSRTN